MFDGLFGLKGKVNGVLNIKSFTCGTMCKYAVNFCHLHHYGIEMPASYAEVSMSVQDMFGTGAFCLACDSVAVFLLNQQWTA